MVNTGDANHCITVLITPNSKVTRNLVVRFSCDCRKHFDKHWISEVVYLGIAQIWLWGKQITVMKIPGE